METFEYYDREKNVVCIGTFTVVEECTPLTVDQLFIVPPDTDKGRRSDGIAGCCEGREKVSGYGLPIALKVKSVSGFHVNSQRGYGSWIMHRCYVEVQ